MTRLLLLAATLACASCAFAAANLIRAERDVQATTALVRASLAAPAVSSDTLWQDIDLHGWRCYCGASTLTTGFGKDTLRVRHVGSEMYDAGVYERVMAEERAAVEVLLGLREQAATAGDTVRLSWTAPAFVALGCGADTTPARDTQVNAVLRLNTVTPPNYRRGCESDPACWDSVRAWNVPDTVARVLARPGTALSARVASGQYVLVARNGIGWSPCWGRIVVVP